MLKPGGILLFRDYGRHDMAQLRFKGGRFMQPGLYIRGDGTRVYFFERDELVDMWGGPVKSSPESIPSGTVDDGDDVASGIDQLAIESHVGGHSQTPRFELIKLGVDRRLLLNRKKQLKMYRIWLQGSWRKSSQPA